jgi:hypothetical protein
LVLTKPSCPKLHAIACLSFGGQFLDFFLSPCQGCGAHMPCFLKGPSHQSIFAWKWYGWISLGGDMGEDGLLRIFKLCHFVIGPWRVSWRLVHPRLVLVTIWPTRLVLVTVGLLNFSTPIFLVPVSFSPQIFCPHLGEGGLIVTCEIWSNLPWQLVHPFCEVKLSPIDTRSLAAYESHCFQQILLKRLGLNGLMTWEERKLEKILIFLLTVLFSMLFFRKYTDQVS